MDNNFIEQRVRSVIKDVLKVGDQSITMDARFKEDLGADSLDLVTLMMALEQEFSGSISDAEATSMTTVGRAIETISRLCSSLSSNPVKGKDQCVGSSSPASV
jgi:acyl carrier protein